ncbi:MAG: hypothetical protein ACR2M5_09285 [Nakamurella sp.]
MKGPAEGGPDAICTESTEVFGYVVVGGAAQERAEASGDVTQQLIRRPWATAERRGWGLDSGCVVDPEVFVARLTRR